MSADYKVSHKWRKTECSAWKISSQTNFDGFSTMGRRKLQCGSLDFWNSRCLSWSMHGINFTSQGVSATNQNSKPKVLVPIRALTSWNLSHYHPPSLHIVLLKPYPPIVCFRSLSVIFDAFLKKKFIWEASVSSNLVDPDFAPHHPQPADIKLVCSCSFW